MSNNGEMGWNDEIEPGGSFCLEKGPAAFTVREFKRERKTMGKLGECNVAVLTLDCVNDAGDTAEVNCNLPLHRKTAFKLFQFFTAIGQRQHGDGPIKPDWSKVDGATGRCILDVREWTGQDQQKHYSNEVVSFTDPEADAGGFAF